MPRGRCFVLGAVLLPCILHAQSAVVPDTAAWAVAYVEVLPASRAAAVAALEAYRDASRKDGGFVRLELFEQVGRPGHFVVVEAWAEAKALEAHGTTAHSRRLADTLQPLRVSGYDQRPYKTLSVAGAPLPPNGAAIHVVTHVDTIPSPGSDGPGLLRRLAEASRQEPGNLRFDVLQHTMRANHFTVVESWRNQQAHAAHAAAPHTRQYRDTLQPMSGGPLDERLHKAVD
jgi:quinol monooxygenase YgiN